MNSVVENLDTIDHIAIQVHDIASAVAWYKKSCRCKVIYQDETWAFIKFHNTFLALVLPNSHPSHIAIACDHPELYGSPKIHRDGTRYVYIKDPHGNVIEMIEGSQHHTLEEQK